VKLFPAPSPKTLNPEEQYRSQALPRELSYKALLVGDCSMYFSFLMALFYKIYPFKLIG